MSRSARPWTALIVAIAAVIVIVAGAVPATRSAYTVSFRHPTDTVTTAPDYARTEFPLRDSFAGGTAGWKTYGGCWSAGTGTFGYGTMQETCGGTGGPKAVNGNSTWTDYTLQGDVQLNAGKQAGLIFRVTNPADGADAFSGYYAAIDAADSSLVLGRMDGGTYTSLQRQSIASGVQSGDDGKGSPFYHLVVQASGCTFTIWQTTVGANTWTSFSYTDPDTTCHRTGAIGLRDQASRAGFRFVTATQGATPSTAAAPWNSTLSTGSLNDGTAGVTYGGTWTVSGQPESIGVVQENVGDKDVLSRTWTDMTMTGDVRMTGALSVDRDAGFVVRVSQPARGLDQLQGFYAGISGSELKLGRQANGWYDVSRTTLARAPVQGEWWHLTVAVTGCTVVATASPTAGGTVQQVSATFSGCTSTSGAVGVRTKMVDAEWRNLAVTPR